MTRPQTYEERAAELAREYDDAIARLDAELAKVPRWVRELIDPRLKQPRTRLGRLAKAWRGFVEEVRYQYRLTRAARAVAQARARHQR